MARKKKESPEDLEAVLKPPSREVQDRPGLSSGSTLLNLACTGRPDACFVAGNYYFVWGGTNSGKTFVSLTALAEAARNPAYDHYRLIFDNPERGAQMDIGSLFGQKMLARLEPPFVREGGSWGYSEYIEDFYAYVRKMLADEKKPCIYVLDSESILTSRAEEEKQAETDEWRLRVSAGGSEGKKPSGQMTDGKAKIHSAGLRTIQSMLDRTGSILIIIGQARDKMNTNPFEEKDTHSGGHALDFYAQVVLRTALGGKEKVKVNDIERHVGNECHFQVRRSRYVGTSQRVSFTIYLETGIDDVGSCVDYLVTEKRWARDQKGVITARDFEFSGTPKKLIEHIQNNGLEPRLSEIAAEVWAQVRRETAEKVGRKKRYE